MNIHITKKLKGNFQTGDTIVEVVISIAITATVLIGAFIASSSSLNSVRNSEERSEILQQLQGQVELLRTAANSPGFFNSTSSGTYGCCPDQVGQTGCPPQNPTATCVTSPFCLGPNASGGVIGYTSLLPPPVGNNPNTYYPPINTTCFPNSTYNLSLEIKECDVADGCPNPTVHPAGAPIFELNATWIPIGSGSYDQIQLFYGVKVSCTGSDGTVGVECGMDGTEGKPVIYLYPTHPENVSVKLTYIAGFSKTVPSYNPVTGWQVYAKPNGELLNKSNNQVYPYLYWEGNPATLNFDMSKGFVVSGKDTKQFLALELPIIGLNQNETNAFLAYWVPRMDNDKYNLIHFAGRGYTSLAPLDITPKPNSLLRVNMIFESLDSPVTVTPQSFPIFHREGFTVVEWGGAELHQ